MYKYIFIYLFMIRDSILNVYTSIHVYMCTHLYMDIHIYKARENKYL